MIRYFCDFCKQELATTNRPNIEVGITVSVLSAGGSSRSTQKVEHICTSCNEAILADLTTRGLEVK